MDGFIVSGNYISGDRTLGSGGGIFIKDVNYQESEIRNFLIVSNIVRSGKGNAIHWYYKR